MSSECNKISYLSQLIDEAIFPIQEEKRDEQELICQGEPFARNVSLVIFLYVFIVLLLFVIIKKTRAFKCTKHPVDLAATQAVSLQIMTVQDILGRPESCLGEFQLKYSECHRDRIEHTFLASIISFILSFRYVSQLPQ